MRITFAAIANLLFILFAIAHLSMGFKLGWEMGLLTIAFDGFLFIMLNLGLKALITDKY